MATLTNGIIATRPRGDRQLPADTQPVPPNPKSDLPCHDLGRHDTVTQCHQSVTVSGQRLRQLHKTTNLKLCGNLENASFNTQCTFEQKLELENNNV